MMAFSPWTSMYSARRRCKGHRGPGPKLQIVSKICQKHPIFITSYFTILYLTHTNHQYFLHDGDSQPSNSPSASAPPPVYSVFTWPTPKMAMAALERSQWPSQFALTLILLSDYRNKSVGLKL